MPAFIEGLKKTYRCNELFEGLLRTIEQSSDNLVFLTDPSVLSKASAYEVVWNSRLPTAVRETLEQSQCHQLNVNYHHRTISLLTDNILSIYQLVSQTEKRKLQIPIHDMIILSQPPLFDVWADSLSAVIVNTHGKLRYVQYGMAQVDFDINLPIGDSISAVRMMHTNQALLGTLSGELYLFKLDNDQQPHLFNFYQYQSWFDTFVLTGSYYRTAVPSLSRQYKSSSRHVIGKVIHLQTINSVHYIGYAKGIQVWETQADNRVELVAQYSMEHTLREEVAQHIPSTYSRNTIQCEIVNMNVHPKSDIVLLVSYTLPDMYGYNQFLVLRCQLEINNEKGTLGLRVMYSTSMSYTSLQEKALLASTDDIAFVTFEDTVIAISTNKKSVFEEAIHVSDQILFTETVLDTPNHCHTALIYTKHNGVIQFSVDINVIQQSWLTNNMYSRTVRNIQESDTDVFKARLEQAVFFGDSPQSPLRFILRQHNQENISLAALRLSSQLLKGECWFLPLTTEDSLYLCALNYFQKRILKAIEESDLLDRLSEQDKQILLRNSQMTTLSYAIASYVMEKQDDTEFMNHLMDSVQPLLRSERDTSIMLLAKTKSTEMMASVLTAIRTFENQCVLYSLDTSFSAIIVGYLFDLWCLSFEANELETPGPMIHIANLILDSLLDEVNQNRGRIPFERVRAAIFNKLLAAYGNEVAMMSQFTRAYGGIPFVINHIQSTRQTREEHVAFIQHLGFDYFSALLIYLCQKENTYSEIEFYSTKYPQYMSMLIDQFTVPKIAWVHYVHQKDYEKAYEQLLLYLDTPMSEQERKEAIAWQRILEACIQEMNA
ncbi:hypothetical protein A0J61_05256 [Choanephora cucurbitarum]|uniref:Uncharacterized protein n=1 Tax=Choanephora cucurbitarum TaxID=101091 RepID=A0A1C7NCI2_9FUNG|nr:hypothetical protein A0J61_05256 [Choanephora cucurbitarum]